MAQISKHMLTMAETVKRTNNDRLVEIAELLEEKNEILDDLQFGICQHRFRWFLKDSHQAA